MRSLRITGVLLAVALVAAGCSKKTPQEVTDLNSALGDAKDACATVYAADDLATVQTDVDMINGLVGDKKMRKAKKSAVAAMPAVADLEQTAEAERAAAKSEAEAAFAKAAGTLEEAAELDAEDLVPEAFAASAARLAEAEEMMQDPCLYPDAMLAAAEADALAREAGVLAVAEAERIAEEEARMLAEAEARRLAEEEAARIAEMEAWLAAHPPEYEVKRGDYLWKISGMERIYDASRYWPIIFDANRKQITNPDLIYPGQILNIPREIEEEEMVEILVVMWGKASRGEDL